MMLGSLSWAHVVYDSEAPIQPRIIRLGPMSNQERAKRLGIKLDIIKKRPASALMKRPAAKKRIVAADGSYLHKFHCIG